MGISHALLATTLLIVLSLNINCQLVSTNKIFPSQTLSEPQKSVSWSEATDESEHVSEPLLLEQEPKAQSEVETECSKCEWNGQRKEGPPRVVLVSVGLYGHVVPLIRMGEVLSKHKGFEVAVATHEHMEKLVLQSNLTFLSAGLFAIPAADYLAYLADISQETSSFRGLLTLFNEIYLPLVKPMMEALLPRVKEFEPDLVVADVGTPAGLALAHITHTPSMINSPTLLRIPGGPFPTHVPHWGTGLSGKQISLLDRCVNVLFPRLLSVALTPAFMQLNKGRTDFNLEPYMAQEDILRGVRILVNTAFGLEYPYKMSPLVEMTGPIMPLFVTEHEDMDLPPMVSGWLQGPQAPVLTQQSAVPNIGVAFVSFGNMVQLQSSQVQVLLDALQSSELFGLRVIWMVPADQRTLLPASLPPNFRIKILGRTPHLKILAHPSVVLGITQCGMGIAQEVLYFGHPLLCLPLLMDQPDIAQRIVDSGAGLLLDKAELNEKHILESIQSILSNQTFAHAAQRIASHLHRAGGATRAADVIENTLLIGSGHLRSLDLLLPWHKAYMVDVWVLLSAVICLAMTGVYGIKLVLFSSLGIGKVNYRTVSMAPALNNGAQKKASASFDDEESQSGDECTNVEM